LPPSFYAAPYPTYCALRQREPVRAMPDGSWFLTRHADLVAVYRDPHTFSSDKRAEFGPKYGSSPLFGHHTTSLVFNDPPLHSRVRRLIAGALTQRAVAAMEPGLVTRVEQLLDHAEAKGRIDLIEDYAAAIPVEIIGNLLAVPQADRASLRGWSLAILGALEPALTPAQERAGNDAVTEFLDYLRGLVAERRRHPGDPAQDVLTRLIQGDAYGRLSEAELLHNCVFILNAGHETTTNLIGNALHTLTQWPEQRARLIAEPALMRTAIEEFLRFESSNQLGNRISTREAQVGGITLPAGSLITLCIGAANRDPAVFADPERLDLSREPNPHLAFAYGIHQCVGMSLARLEGRIAIGQFLARFPAYELAGPPVRGGRARFRGFLSIPVRVR